MSAVNSHDAQLEFDFATPAGMTSRARLPVVLRPGTRRRRHVEAELCADHIVVTHPPRMSRREARLIAEELRERLERRIAAERIDLPARARHLAHRHGLPAPERVEWSERQQAQWGSCDRATATIRLSGRLAALPDFVLDYVIVHELAHLVHADHGPAFHALVARYPRSERAIGYLTALDHHRPASARGQG
jgi:hypothetical protein